MHFEELENSQRGEMWGEVHFPTKRERRGKSQAITRSAADTQSKKTGYTLFHKK